MAKGDASGANLRADSGEWQEVQSLLEAVIAPAEDGFLAVDAQGVIRLASPIAMQIFGWEVPPLHAECWRQAPVFDRDDSSAPLPHAQHPLSRALRGECGREELLRVRSADGQMRSVSAGYGPLRSRSGECCGALLWLRDVTEDQQLRELLGEHHTRFEMRTSIMTDVTSRTPMPELIGRALTRMLESFPRFRACYCVVEDHILRVIDARQPASMPVLPGSDVDLNEVPGYLLALDGAGYFACSDVETEGRVTPVLQRLRNVGIRAFINAPLRQSETLRGILALHADEPHEWTDHEATTLRMVADYLSLALIEARLEQERHAAQSELEWSVLHDRLTGLANRALFMDRLEQAIRRVRRSRRPYAVLFLDFDYFKVVNESLGHEVGDKLLIDIANRLRANLREGDTSSRWGGESLPARLGGDEFVLLLEDIGGLQEVERIAQRIQDSLSRPHQVAGHEITATASIGIVVDDGCYESPAEVLRDADTAMYRAKQQGKARHVVFDEEMHAAAMHRLTLERELRQAIERSQFTLHYQPIIALRGDRVVGFEALLRWHHPTRGMVPPGEFIPLAEEIGLVIPMGEWVLHAAARQLAEWQRRFPSMDLSVSVNVSKRQVVHPGLVYCVQRLLADTHLAPSALKLEITESAVMENPSDAAPVLLQLEGLGVRLAMDDFGTGHSSLGTLQRFPIHVLKVDRSFIHALDEQPEYAAITQAIVTLAHSLRMTVVAEGVEKREHVELLRELECDEVQGFFFARPMPAESATALLERIAAGGSI